jgi:hypothetical protein
MSTELIALLSGLVGAFIGASASVITIIIQERHQSKRDRSKLAAELGMRDFENTIEVSKRISGTKEIPPLVSFVLFHDRIMKHLEKGKFTADDYQRICKEHEAIYKEIKQVSCDNKNRK